MIFAKKSLAIDPHRELLINKGRMISESLLLTLGTLKRSFEKSEEEALKKLGYATKKLREAVVSFTEAGGRREQFAAVQQLDFSGFTTTVDTRTNATKDLRDNADSLRDPFTTDPHMEVPHY